MEYEDSAGNIPRYANLDENAWMVEDIVQYRDANPDIVNILSEEERSSVRPGDRVQLRFLLVETRDESEDGHPKATIALTQEEAYGEELCVVGESMWVTVDEVVRQADGSVFYIGTLDDAPLTANALDFGDRVTFGPQHVANWWTNPPAYGASKESPSTM